MRAEDTSDPGEKAYDAHSAATMNHSIYVNVDLHPFIESARIRCVCSKPWPRSLRMPTVVLSVDALTFAARVEPPGCAPESSIAVG